MSWRNLISVKSQLSQPARSLPAPSFYSSSALWCWFIVGLKRLLSIFVGRLEFYQDPQIVSENVLQKHSPLRLYASVVEALTSGLEEGKPAALSTRSILLNSDNNIAKWRFEAFGRPDEVPHDLLIDNGDKEAEFDSWGESTAVPMNWQMPLFQTKKSAKMDVPIYTNFFYPFAERFTNFSTYVSMKGNPCAVYRGIFKLPETWCDEYAANDGDLVLILHGAGSGVEVFVNGVRLGYHTDSMTEHEYFIPMDCVPRDPRKPILLTFRVFKYCSGSYLEDQDQWWLTGIHRDIELQLRPRVACLWDLDVRASYAAARVEISCEVSLNASPDTTPFAIRATLYESSTVPLETLVLPVQSIPKITLENSAKKFEKLYLDETRVRAVASGSMFVLPKERIEPWTAENPQLYSLTLELLQLGTETNPEKVIQVEIVRVGFRDARVNPETHQFEVNGKRVVFRGVNRHEFSPHRGKCLSEDDLITDILQMKRHNFNAVRNCHYPNTRRWYELCDFYGLYVIDEANIETHGFVLAGAISLLQFDSRFKDAFLSRCYAMVLRSRNHPSIIAWSLGNESGYGPNTYDCSRLVRILDDERLVLYEGGTKAGVPLILGDGRNVVSDFIFPMYHTPSQIFSYHDESINRNAPVVLCEYAHCMGNSGGGLHLYWDLFWRDKGPWQGGFIWDWVDQGISFVYQSSSHSSGGSLSPESTRHMSSSHNMNTSGHFHNSSSHNLLSHRSLEVGGSASNNMSSTTKTRRSSSVSLPSYHRDGEMCVSKERLWEISFQGKGWAYGGDFGEKSGAQDAQFCLNGIVFPERTPKPALLEAKYLMQPYRFLLEGVMNDQLELSIHSRFSPGVAVDFVWTLIAEEFTSSLGSAGRATEKTRGSLNVDFMQSSVQTAKIPLVVTKDAEDPSAPEEEQQQSSMAGMSKEFVPFFLRVQAVVAGVCKWAEPGHELAYEVFELVRTSDGKFGRALPPDPANVLPKATLVVNNESSSATLSPVDGTHQLVIHNDEYDARVDLKTGALVSFRGKDGMERLAGPSALPCFYRACIDNDLGGAEVHVKSTLLRTLIRSKYWSYAGRWRGLDLDAYDETKKWKHVQVDQTGSNQVTVIRTDKLFRVETVFNFLNRGVRVGIRVEWIGGNIGYLDSIPRVGTFFEFASTYSKVTYCGRGPFENYPDRKKSASVGIYTQSADDFHVPYIVPSENGGRGDVRWLVMEDQNQRLQNIAAGFTLSYSCLDAPEWSDDEENNLATFAGQRFKRPAGTRGAQVSISRFHVSQLDKARHQSDLVKDLNDWRNASLKVIMDTAHMGVGGDVSWLPSVHDPFKINFFDSKTGKGMVWTYQIDMDIITQTSEDDVDELRHRQELFNGLRKSRSSLSAG